MGRANAVLRELRIYVAAEPMKKWYGNRGRIYLLTGGGGGGGIISALRICASMHELCDGANALCARTPRTVSDSGTASPQRLRT